MERETLGPVQAVEEGWAVFSRHAAVLLAGSVAFLALVAACVMLPIRYVNWVLLATVTFPLLGGLHVMFLKAARDAEPRLTNLLCGFRHPVKWLLAGWAFGGVFNVFLTPCLLLLMIALALVGPYKPTAATPNDLHIILWTYTPALALIPAFILFLQYAFMLLAAPDTDGVGHATARSQELVKGRYIRLLLALLPAVSVYLALLLVGCLVFQTNANAFGWPGWAAYGLGLFLATVVALSIVTATYVRLDRLTPRQQDSHISSAAA